jgi:hypothetical protein
MILILLISAVCIALPQDTPDYENNTNITLAEEIFTDTFLVRKE